MAYTIPTVAEFKTQFYRDFPYAVPASGTGGDDTDLSKVTNFDIQNAINLANANMNQALFPTQARFTQAYLYAAAHYLVTNLKASNQGLFSQFNWNVNQKTVGGVQESFQIPERITRSPWLSHFSQTRYGAQYLSIIIPLLTGHVVTVEGMTTP